MITDTHKIWHPRHDQPQQGETVMISRTTTDRRLRVLLTALMLFLASALSGGSAAVAGVLQPNADMGAPGGGGASATLFHESINSSITPGVREF